MLRGLSDSLAPFTSFRGLRESQGSGFLNSKGVQLLVWSEQALTVRETQLGSASVHSLRTCSSKEQKNKVRHLGLGGFSSVAGAFMRNGF